MGRPRKSRATGKPPGPPPKFSTPEEMQPLIDNYFITCDKGVKKEFFDRKKKTVVKVMESVPYTMEGLALALGLNSVGHMWQYIKRPMFVDVLTRAKTKIIRSYNEYTLLGVYPHTFTPFLLCNMDKDNYKSINNSNVNLNIGLNMGEQLNKGIARVANVPKQIADRKGINLLPVGQTPAEKRKKVAVK